MLRLAQHYGLVVSKVIMSMNTALSWIGSAEVQAKIKASFQLVGMGNKIETVFETLIGKPLTITERLYADESKLTAVNAPGDTVINVENSSAFLVGDVCTMRNTNAQEEEVVIESISGNAITIEGNGSGSGLVYTYGLNDRFTAYHRFWLDNYVGFPGSTPQLRSGSNNWISTPSLIKALSWNKQLPGRYTWMDFETKVPYKLEIGAGVSGGPKVSHCDWMVLKTQ
jgi:hypothetical protein